MARELTQPFGSGCINEVLLKKLKRFGIRPMKLEPFVSFPKKKTTWCHCDQKYSEIINVKCSMPNYHESHIFIIFRVRK